jgi:hypothetical protein
MNKIDKRIKSGLNYSIKDGVAWSVNDGLGSSYVSPYREVRKVQPSRPLWYFMGSFIRRRFHI